MSTTQTGSGAYQSAPLNGGGSLSDHNTPPAAPGALAARPAAVPLRRVPAGRVNGVHAPVGTVLGPKVVTREYVVVTGTDDQGVTVGYATAADFRTPEAFARMAADPQSLTECLMVKGWQVNERVRMRALFGDHRRLPSP